MGALVTFRQALEVHELGKRRFVQHVLLDAVVDNRDAADVVDYGRVRHQ